MNNYTERSAQCCLGLHEVKVFQTHSKPGHVSNTSFFNDDGWIITNETGSTVYYIMESIQEIATLLFSFIIVILVIISPSIPSIKIMSIYSFYLFNTIYGMLYNIQIESHQLNNVQI